MEGKREPGEIISHLQIINTWASFALERDINFFNEAHLKKMTEWTEDAIDLLKQNENDIHHMSLIVDEYENENGKKKEPDAVEPDVLDFARYTNGRKQRRRAWCGACGLRIRIGSNKQDRSNYCERCGKAIKWE